MAGSPPDREASISHFEALGMMTELALHSPLHRNWSIADIGRNFLPALRVGQCKIYFDERRSPISFVTWALVDDACHEALRLRGETPAHDRWASGARLWFIDVVAPFGDARHLIRDLQRNHFAHLDRAHAVRRHIDGSFKRIQTWRNGLSP
ncbi:toxin-activating lysine-acyltransferase [Bosea sp. (in: a-proteobacteria)]|uniref:toxin-activating lysine-acyltransferase n=1 Tax=Bosea sp. (in: a-proteobacteria) TaxID=1871050 RepID=UPI003F702032